MSGTVFVSHVEEDADLALGIALALEAEGFGTWCYEVDSVPGPSYLIQTGRAIDQSKAMILVISPHSIGSHQVTRELVRAYESNKKFLPILRDVTHLEFQTRQPEWREALGAAASVSTPAGGAGAIMDRICEGLRALGVEPGASSSAARLAALRTALARAPAHPPGAEPPGAETGGVFAEAGVRHESTGRGGRAVRSTPAARSLRVLVLVAVVGALAAVYWTGPHFASRNGATTREAVRADARPGAPGSQAVGVMEIRARGEVPDWMREFTRDGLNTILSKAGLPVYAKQKIDFLRERRGLSEIEAAEQLGIQKMVSGTLRMVDSRVVLEVEVVDIQSGMLDDSETVQGALEHLVELQNQIALNVLRRMHVQLSPEQVKTIFAARTNDTLDSYKLLTETLGDPGTEQQGRPRTGAESPSYALSFPWTAVAWAGDEAPEESAIRTALERYRRALEQKDIDTLTALSVTMSDGQREALTRYFQNADRLQIQFSNFDILLEGDEALATFTRADSFKDVRSGQDMHLEVRISSVLAKQGDGWKIRALKRPS